MNSYLDVAFRCGIVYLFMVAGLRLFGKNQLSQLNAGDVILLLLLSNAVQNSMVGSNTSLESGLLAALVLFLINFLLKKIMFRNPKIKTIIEDEPQILIKDGVIDLGILKKSEISEDELQETIREHGVEDSHHVKLAVLEVDGNISIVSLDANSSTHFSRHKRKFTRTNHIM